MSDVQTAPKLRHSPDYLALRGEVEEFLYDEAELLDTRDFNGWLDLLEDDIRYFMPITFNVKFGEHGAGERTRVEEDMSWFNEGKWSLTKRVEQILTGVHWAEEPLSRCTRMVTNVQVTHAEDKNGVEELSVRSRLLLYQNRCEYEQTYFPVRRYDTLRRANGALRIAERKIILEQTVLLAKNLTVFF